ncbi:MAG: lysophospholipid acyltransferase family protein, partial [Gemmatimonadales bacterium]
SGALFHGPAYQRLRRARRSSRGADAMIAWEPEIDRRERVSHFVLDAALHAIPHDAMHEWFPEIEAGQVAYPAILERLQLFADPPTRGETEVRVRPAGLRDGSPRFPRVHVQLLHGGAVWAELVLVEACLPATRLGLLPGTLRRSFLRDGVFVPGARLSEEHAGESRLTARVVGEADWLPGTVDAVYGLTAGAAASAGGVEAVVTREHAAQRLAEHPHAIAVGTDGAVRTDALPLLDYRIGTQSSDGVVTVRDVAPPALDMARVARWWADAGWQSTSPELHALFMAACAQFVEGVRLVDPSSRATMAGEPVLLLANHQVAIESALAGIVLPPLLGRPILTVAKVQHRATWVGQLALQLNDPRRGEAIAFVDRDRPEELLANLEQMGRVARAGERALLVHVEGTRALAGSQSVKTSSAIWFDLAVQAGLTIVPLRFTRGLPRAGVAERQEFPVGYGAQELVLGRPISGASLAGLRLDERRAQLLAGLAELEVYDAEPRPDAAFAAQVAAARARWALDELRAVFLVLQARAAAWPLDAEGLPADAVAAGDDGHPFWAWFHGATSGSALTSQGDDRRD